MGGLLEAGTLADLSEGLARRLAAALAQTPGVASALIASREGDALGAAGSAMPAQQAALATFIAYRAEALPMDGDLRGLGKLLTEGHLEHVTISGPKSQAVVVRRGDCYLYLVLKPGMNAESVLPNVRQVLRKYV
jgi:hypothetical protein